MADREGGVAVGPIPTAVQSHLKLVYLSLGVALASSALGVYLHVAWNIGGALTTLGFLWSIVWLFSVPVNEARKRFGLLMAAALLVGATLGHMIKLSDPSILVTAVVRTAIAFGCYSFAANIASRREYLYLGLLWLQFAASFGHFTSSFMFEVNFPGMLVFLGYMVYNTQKIIERARHDDMDYIKDALIPIKNFVATMCISYALFRNRNK